MFGIDDAALAGILGGLISTAGKLYTNRENISAEEKANEINWEIARLNNATEVEMANTAHQREIADLRAAGLNPILSAGGNGSSTPTLQTPTLNPVHTDSDLFEGLANSASGLSRYVGEAYKANLANAVSQNDLLQAEFDSQMLDNYVKKNTSDADIQQFNIDSLNRTLEKNATEKELGFHMEVQDGEYVPVVDDYDQFKRSRDLFREGLRSDLKNRANANWRNNLKSVVGAGAEAVNSAVGVGRYFKAGKQVYRGVRSFSPRNPIFTK